MAANLGRLVPPRFYAIHPSTGRPVSFGSVKFYSAGTTTMRDIYADPAGASVAQNPMPLDEAGSCEVYLSGPYRIVVSDANGAVVYDADRVNSVIAETPAGNPGSLIASNNLSDLTDVAAARDALGLAKQTGTGDATSGRVLLVGAFGLGGSAPTISVSANALDDIGRVSGWVYVPSANVSTVNGPSGAGAGIVETMRVAADSVLHQVYYPVGGANSSPWRRSYAAGAWSAWLRDFDYGSTPGVSQWSRTAANVQRCTRLAATFIFDDSSTLACTYTLPKIFTDEPSITLTYPSAGSNTTNCAFGDFGAVRKVAGLSSSITILITKVSGAANFTSGSQVTNVRIEATGPWF